MTEPARDAATSGGGLASIRARSVLGLPVVEKTQGNLHRGSQCQPQGRGGLGSPQMPPLTVGAESWGRPVLQGTGESTAAGALGP